MARVPNLILQPLVENAIKHGIAKKVDSGLIHIQAARRDGMLQLTVRDNGPGLTPNGSAEVSGTEGVGLHNTRRRLKELYGERYGLKLENAPDGGLIVLLQIPFEDVASSSLFKE